MDTNRREEQQADYQFYVAKGSHYQIGLQTARQAASLIGPKHDYGPEHLAFAEQCRKLTLDIYPEIAEEFRGYADGLGLTEEDVVWHYSLGMTGGCSAIAVRTATGMVVGRNYDFYYWENRRHLINTKPDSGFSHIGMHEGLIGGRFDGLNDKGLFISFNGAGPHPEPASPGMSFHLIVRFLLEKCADAAEAKAALWMLPVKEPKSYLIVDRNEAFVVEAHPDRREVRQMERDYLIVTNHYVHPAMTSYQPEWPNSAARYKKLEESVPLLMNLDFQPVETMQRLLADHEAPTCGHQDGMATFWSCVADMENREIAYCLGAPCRNPYRRYP